MRSLLLSLALLSGCTSTVPYTGVGPHSQISRGHPNVVIDTIGNLLSIPHKIILWDRRFNIHFIAADTEATLVDYLEFRDIEALKDTRFSLNEYDPIGDLRRLIRNGHVGWPYRIILGIPTTLIMDVLLPGRIIPYGDYYNPYTNTAHLYSNHAAIALHEAGHAYDIGKKRFKGTYAALRLLPFVDLYQEWKATDEAFDYITYKRAYAMQVEAYKILYPAYGTYVGSYFFPPIGTVAGAGAGHVVGRIEAHSLEKIIPEGQ